MEAFLLLASLKIGLRLLPLRTLRRLLARLAPVHQALPEADPDVAADVVRAVTVAGDRLPALLNCLPRALAAQVLLARRGYRSDLRIGVSKTGGLKTGGLMAHAWVEGHGVVLIGGASSPSRFTPLPSLEEANRRGVAKP